MKDGLPELSKGQKRIVTEMYESFGEEIFSVEMVVTTLEYRSPKICAYLHQLTLLRILECRKGEVYRYQFLINPEEHPECFDIAA